jgi:hypothetical protein
MTRIPDGATLAYPPGWRVLPGDRGSASAALRTAGGRYLGYLNITPRQGGERERNWGAFRIRHNRAEGNTDVRLSASARALRFRDGHGACVQDSYTTVTRARYVEIACLVSGAGAADVIVGAAPPAAWRAQAPTIERAISAMTV